MSHVEKYEGNPKRIPGGILYRILKEFQGKTLGGGSHKRNKKKKVGRYP